MELFLTSIVRVLKDYTGEGDYPDWNLELGYELDTLYINNPIGYTEQTRGPKMEWKVDTFNVAFDANVGDELYALVVRWGDGDSFGNSSGNGEAFWVFKDKALAFAAAKEWEDYDYDKTHDWSVSFEIDGGLLAEFYNPAAGYFNNLESVEVVPMTLRRYE